MLLLQISDIHFQSPHCLNPQTDPDRGIRTRLTRHLAQQVQILGSVDAILVSGDIAFKGVTEEYKVALQWFQELQAISGCPEERIYVVPGNHDVNRKAISDSVPTRNAQHMVATAQENKRETALRDQLGHQAAGQALLFGHTAYNDFAALFNCQIYPERIHWVQDLPLGQGVKLRLHGLSSTLLSGQNGANDVKPSLYLSPLQTSPDPVPDVVNLTICHHPLDWLIDGDAVEDALNSRVMFQLFGHKHRQRLQHDLDYVRVGAGAVNPSRSEPQYEPGYNLMRIEVEGHGKDRCIKVETHQFKLQTYPEKFVPIQTNQGEDVFRTTIRFPEDLVPHSSSTRSGPAHSNSVSVADANDIDEPADVGDKVTVEASMGERQTRGIVTRFWKLKSSEKRALALNLGLITKEEIALPEPERYGKALLRAKERNLIDELEREISKAERTN